MFRIIEKGGSIDAPIVSLPSFRECAKWLVAHAEFFGTEFEVWCVRIFKTKPNYIRFECAYEVLP